MPTTLTEDLAWEWMFGNQSEDRVTEIAKYQFHPNKMEACSIAKDFQQALDRTAPFEYQDLEPLNLVA